MANDQLIVSTKRLGIDLRDLKTSLRKSYPRLSQQVTSSELKQRASTLAEVWLADLSQKSEMADRVSAKYLADLNVHFQRILICAERATVRRRYEEEINSVLHDFTANLVVPLMQGVARARPNPADAGDNAPPARAPGRTGADADGFQATAFVGHSFAPKDVAIVRCVTDVLETVGIRVVTGEKPKADRISSKVKTLIEGQHLFVGIFTRRDKLAGKKEWNTSTWVIDEKAYASRNKKLILLKEAGVESIGGIQGDHEYIEFSRERFGEAIVALLQVFRLTVDGLS
jgi:hypothetical protein